MFVRSKLDRRFAHFCRTGDPDALGYVFDLTAGRLLRVALWLSRQRADAEDLLQRTFVQAIALRERFEAGRPVLPWLMGLMANQAHLLRRERQRREDAAPRVERVVDPEAEAVAHELQDAVRAVRARLGEPYRDVLELHLEQGLDAGEIAARLGRPAGTVRTQLVRALEMLRKKLPSGFVAGFAPLSVGGGGLGTVRGAVVAAARRVHVAGTASAAAFAVGIGGLLMAKKLLVVVPVLAVLLGVAAQQVWSRQTRKEPAAPLTPDPVAAAVDAPKPTEEPTAVPPLDRRDVTSDPSAKKPAKNRQLRVAPWPARFYVVDESGQPVADAHLQLRGQDDPDWHLGLETDAGGRASCTIDVPVAIVAAEKDGSLSTRVDHLTRVACERQEVKLTLETPVLLCGVVRTADGTAVAGAKITARVDLLLFGVRFSRPPSPDDVVAGADGRFEVLVRCNVGYRLRAACGDAQSFEDRVWIRDMKPPAVTLEFPGSFTISGQVVDAVSRPVAGASVTIWREFQIDVPEPDPYASERLETETDAAGRFSAPVRRPGRYELIAHKDGFANSHVTWCEVTAARPHMAAGLELLSMATIRGRVLGADGEPRVGIGVGARAESGRILFGLADHTPDRGALFGAAIGSRTDQDGGFSIAVHPDTNWTVLVWPVPDDGRMSKEVAGVQPGTDDLEVRIDPAEVAGCEVHGTVVRADGLPAGAYRVEWIVGSGEPIGRSRNPPIGNPAPARIDGAEFRIGPGPLGRSYCLVVWPQDREGRMEPNTGPLAPVRVGPFTTDRPQLELEFRLQPWGEVPVRVLGADGLPAKGVLVAIASLEILGVGDRAVVDDLGGVELRRCCPGRNRLVGVVESQLDRGIQGLLFDRDLIVSPGRNAQVTVQLPAPPPAKDR